MGSAGLILGKPCLGTLLSASCSLKALLLRQSSSKMFLHWLLPVAHFVSLLKPGNLALLGSPSPSKTLVLLRPADTFCPLSKVSPFWHLTLLSSSCFLAPSPLGHHNLFVPILFRLSECCFSASFKRSSSASGPLNVGDLWDSHLDSLLTPHTFLKGALPHHLKVLTSNLLFPEKTSPKL